MEFCFCKISCITFNVLLEKEFGSTSEVLKASGWKLYTLCSHSVPQTETVLSCYDRHDKRSRDRELLICREAGRSPCVKLTQKQIIMTYFPAPTCDYLNYFQAIYFLRKAVLKFIMFFLHNFNFKITSLSYIFVYIVYLNITLKKCIHLYLSVWRRLFFPIFICNFYQKMSFLATMGYVLSYLSTLIYAIGCFIFYPFVQIYLYTMMNFIQIFCLTLF